MTTISLTPKILEERRVVLECPAEDGYIIVPRGSLLGYCEQCHSEARLVPILQPETDEVERVDIVYPEWDRCPVCSEMARRLIITISQIERARKHGESYIHVPIRHRLVARTKSLDDIALPYESCDGEFVFDVHKEMWTH